MENFEENVIATSKIKKEVAEKEVNSWLDFKKIDPLQREEQKDQVKALVSFVENGNLILNEDFTFTHILKFPLGEDGKMPVKELKYKARLKERELSSSLSNVKADDSEGRLMAHYQALTGEAKGIIAGLDKEDIKIARSIAVFFL